MSCKNIDLFLKKHKVNSKTEITLSLLIELLDKFSKEVSEKQLDYYYFSLERECHIIKMKALGIDTEGQTFDQMVNTLIYMAAGTIKIKSEYEQ